MESLMTELSSSSESVSVPLCTRQSLISIWQGERRWRALADLTANELTNGRQKASTEGEAVRSALHLWSIRFGCLRRLGFYSIMASESAGLFSTLGTPFHSPLPAYNPDKPTLNQTYNLHLLQLWAISPLFVGGDRFLVIKQLREVMHGCKYEFWRTQQHTWKDGVLSTSLILANLCLDMQEYEQVDRILAAILAQNKDIDTLTHSILFYLDMGDIVRAQQMLDELLTLPEGKTRRALLDRILLLARDEQTGTEEASLSEEPDSLVGQNNAAVSCLYSGRIREVSSGPSRKRRLTPPTGYRDTGVAK